MDYTALPENYLEEYYNKFKLPEDGFRVSLCRKDPTKFVYFMLGKTLRSYQSYLIDNALVNQKNIWCIPRQLGKTVDIICLAFWAAWFNIYANTKVKRMSEGAHVYIMSRTEDQAKEVLLRIREIIRDGDAHMSKILRKTAKHQTDFFSSQIIEPNNMFQITFRNGSFIKCVPPTDIVRGKDADWFFIDEAGFLRHDNPDKLWMESIEPTTSQTDGITIISSTPNGQQGFFFKTIDPFDQFPETDFFKAWFHYTIYDNPEHIAKMKAKEREMRSKGEGKSFEQEYEAKFVSSSESFFDSYAIDDSCSAAYNLSECKDRDCVIGIDYGMVSSRSAIAISYFDEEEAKIITCYVNRFKKGKDLNDLVPFIQGLIERFRVTKIVADDCPEGFAVNQAMESKGWNVERFNFTKDKTETYCSYRANMHRGKVGLHPDRDLMLEMKGLQQEETINGKLKIYKGGGLTDDLCDAVIMSAKQWLREEEGDFGLELV